MSHRQTATARKITQPMASISEPRTEGVDPIRQLEIDLKRAMAEPSLFPRTNKLLCAGVAQQAKKLVEEAAELAIEAMRSNREAAVLETADLVYNLVVLLEGMDVPFEDVLAELARRRRVYGIAAKQKNGALSA